MHQCFTYPHPTSQALNTCCLSPLAPAGMNLAQDSKLPWHRLRCWLRLVTEYKPPAGRDDHSSGGGEVLMRDVSADTVMVDVAEASTEQQPMDSASAEQPAPPAQVAAAEEPGSAACLLPAEQLEQLLPLLLKHWRPLSAGVDDAVDMGQRLVQALLLLAPARLVPLVWQHWEVAVPLLAKAQPGLPLQEWRELLGRWAAAAAAAAAGRCM